MVVRPALSRGLSEESPMSEAQFIVLTETGDTIRFPLGSELADRSKLPRNGKALGLHEFCSGVVCIVRRSRTHSAISCSGKCGLVELVPNTALLTLGTLRKYFEKKLQPAGA